MQILSCRDEIEKDGYDIKVNFEFKKIRCCFINK